MTTMLLPVPGCLVKHKDFGIGRVAQSATEGGSTRVEVHWPQNGVTAWHSVQELSCGFRVGDTVQDSPHSNTRRTMGSGTVREIRTLASRHQVMVQFRDSGETKPKPRWDVHLPGAGNRGRSLEGVFRPLIAGPSGSAVSPRLSGWTARPGICRPSPAPPPCCPSTDCQWPPLSPNPR